LQVSYLPLHDALPIFNGGIPFGVSAVTINKVCGSGLKAVMMAAQGIQLGDAEVVVAGGMESMTNAPYLLPKAREGYRLGNGVLVDRKSTRLNSSHGSI